MEAPEQIVQYEKAFVDAIKARVVVLDEARQKQDWLENLYASIYEAYERSKKALAQLEGNLAKKKPKDEWEIARWEINRTIALMTRPSLTYYETMAEIQNQVLSRLQKQVEKKKSETKVITVVTGLLNEFAQPNVGQKLSVGDGKEKEEKKKKIPWLVIILAFAGGMVAKDALSAAFSSLTPKQQTQPQLTTG